MAYQPAVDVASVQMQYTFANQRIQNDYTVQGTGAWSEADLQTLGDVFVSWFTTEQQILLPPSIMLTQVVVTDLTSLEGARVSMPVAEVGTSEADALPANVTIAVKFSTGHRGRGRQGRIFWPLLVRTQVNGDVMLLAAQDAIIEALNALKTDVNASVNGAILSVLHRQANGVPLPTATTSPVLSFIFTDNTVDSQKNRLPNHKRKSKAWAPPAA